ncbi:unnamed protein product [Chrysoparadoxa australica]
MPSSAAYRASECEELPDYKLAKNQVATNENVELYEASTRGDLAKVKKALKNGASPNWFKKPEEGAAALHKASEGGHASVARELIQAGGVVDERLVTNHNTSLHLASAKGHVDAALALLDGQATINTGNAFGNTPLHEACVCGSEDMVKCLIKRGADINWANTRDSTPLHFASYGEGSSKSRIAICKLLLDEGADIDAKDSSGMAPLHIAGRDGDMELASFFLDKGASRHLEDGAGKTPYDYARLKDNAEMASLLK